MAKAIDYGNLMHKAMCGLIQTVLKDVAAFGLPGAHHFFITFDTTSEGVELADWLRTRYPGEMTIVVQNWFENLTVSKDSFSITLNFGNNPERMTIPYDALRTFVDPSVEFGLRFDAQVSDDDDEGPDDEPPAPQHDATVVRLDKFRKS